MSSFLLLLIRAHFSLSLISPASQKCGSYRDVLSSLWHDSPVTCRKGRRPRHSARWTRKPQWRSGHRTHTKGYLNCCGSKQCSAHLDCKEKRLLGFTCHTYTDSICSLTGSDCAQRCQKTRNTRLLAFYFCCEITPHYCSPGWSWTNNPPTSASQVLRTQCVPPHLP